MQFLRRAPVSYDGGWESEIDFGLLLDGLDVAEAGDVLLDGWASLVADVAAAANAYILSLIHI